MLLRIDFWNDFAGLPKSSAFVPPCNQIFSLFRTRSRSIFRLGVQSLSDRSRSDDGCGKVIMSDFRSFSIRVKDRDLVLLRAFVDLRRSLASVSRRANPMDFAHEPLQPTFTKQVSGPALPKVVRAVNGTVSIFDLELHKLGVYVTLAGCAYKYPAGGWLH